MIPIHVSGGRGLIFDIKHLKQLREDHHICGTLTGILPQIPQQNVFMGLPLELMAEDVEYLVRNEIAYLVDDYTAHQSAVLAHTEKDLQEIENRNKIRHARETEEYKQLAWSNRQTALAKQAKKKGVVYIPEDDHIKQQIMEKMSMDASHEIDTTSDRLAGYKLFEQNTPSNKIDKPIPAAYQMYEYLHRKGYFMSPGLRFGGQFLAYPGDPLRFHSHYTATGYGYDEEFKVLDVVSSGRLGTAVKKCWVVGAQGEDSSAEDNDSERYKAYSIEWAGFG